MQGHRNQEPVLKFYEEVHVGRNSVQERDVILYYTNPGQGRGEFQVTVGRILRMDYVEGDCRLAIKYSILGDNKSFEITRNRGGGYTLHTDGYWKEELERPQE